MHLKICFLCSDISCMWYLVRNYPIELLANHHGLVSSTFLEVVNHQFLKNIRTVSITYMLVVTIPVPSMHELAVVHGLALAFKCASVGPSWTMSGWRQRTSHPVPVLMTSLLHPYTTPGSLTCPSVWDIPTSIVTVETVNTL